MQSFKHTERPKQTEGPAWQSPKHTERLAWQSPEHTERPKQTEGSAWQSPKHRKVSLKTTIAYTYRKVYSVQYHSCQPLLGANLSPEFVNLYFPYAGRGLLFLRW